MGSRASPLVPSLSWGLAGPSPERPVHPSPSCPDSPGTSWRSPRRTSCWRSWATTRTCGCAGDPQGRRPARAAGGGAALGWTLAEAQPRRRDSPWPDFLPPRVAAQGAGARLPRRATSCSALSSAPAVVSCRSFGGTVTSPHTGSGRLPGPVSPAGKQEAVALWAGQFPRCLRCWWPSGTTAPQGCTGRRQLPRAFDSGGFIGRDS